MNKTKYIPILLICLLTVGGIIAVNSNSRINAVSAVTPSPTPAKRFSTQTKPISEHLVYGVLFLQIKTLGEKDAESFAAGDTTEFKNSFYKNKLNLSPSKFSGLNTLVNDYFAEIQPIDQQAKQIITQYRNANAEADGKLKAPSPTPTPTPGIVPPRVIGRTFEKLPPPPAQLIQLQNQKKQIILSYKPKMEQLLGSTAFAQFNITVHDNATNVIVPLNLGNDKLPSLPKPTPTPTPGN